MTFSVRPSLQEHGSGPNLLLKGSRRVKLFVLGAGVSNQFGVPLANTLLDEVLEWAEMNGEAARATHLREFIGAFYHDPHPRSGRLPPAEDVLTFLEAAGEYSEIRGSGVGYKWRRDRVEQIREAFLKVLGRFLWSFQESLEENDLSIFRRFVRLTGRGQVYVTFNYDLLLETALSLENIPYHYNGAPSSDSVLILKPYGSINWFASDDLNDRQRRAFVPLGRNILAAPAMRFDDLPFRTPKSPVLIAPAVRKQFSTFEQRKIWTLFSSVVQRTSLAFVVGYSLPIADHTARIVMNRLGAHQGFAKRIHVINPDPIRLTDPSRSLSNHYADLVSRTHFFMPMTFAEWVQTDPYFNRGVAP